MAKSFRALLIGTFLAVLPAPLVSEPQIKQIFPAHDVFLGQPLIWIIEIRHPLWENYTLSINPCSGADIRIVDRTITRENGEVRSRYRMRIVPLDLTVSDIPSVVVTDEKGQSTVLNGQLLVVQSISGNSLDIKDPKVPDFSEPPANKANVAYAALILLSLALAFLYWRQFQRSTPRQVFRRALTRALAGIRREGAPLYLSKLLRSQFVWGFPAEAWTASQLHDTAKTNLRLRPIADAIHSLDMARYSGNPAQMHQTTVEKAVRTALEIVDAKKP